MKRIVIIGLLVAAFCVPSVFAVQKGTSITVNPLGLAVGLFNAEVNFGVSPNLSVPVSGSYLGYESGDDEFSLYGLGAGLRYYWQGNAANGWYVGGQLNYYSAKAETTLTEYTFSWTGWSSVEYTGSATASALGYGALIGYQSIWGGGFTLDTGIGIQMVNIPDIDTEVESSGGLKKDYTVDGISATVPLIQLALGYAF